MRKYTTILLIIVFAMGCSSGKKLLEQQKQFEEVGRAWAKKNPCANDTTIVVKPGRVDTLTIPAPVVDLSYASDSIAQALADKFHTNLEDCDRQVKEAFNAGYLKSSAEWGKIKIPVKRPDTINHYVVDNRAVNVLQDENAELNKDVLKNFNTAEHYKYQRNRARSICASLILIMAAIVYFKFFRK